MNLGRLNKIQLYRMLAGFACLSLFSFSSVDAGIFSRKKVSQSAETQTIPKTPNRGGFAPEETSFTTKLGIAALAFLTKDKNIDAGLRQITDSCIRQMRANYGRDFFSYSAQAKSGILGSFRKHEDNSYDCNSVLTWYAKDLKTDGERKDWISNINSAAAYLNKIYGKPKMPDDPVADRYNQALASFLDKEKPFADFSRKNSREKEDVILHVESGLTRSLGKAAAEDAITYYQHGIDRYMANPEAKTLTLNVGALSKSIPTSTRARAQDATSALFGGASGDAARARLGITSKPTFEFTTSTEKDKLNRKITGTVEDCLALAKSLKKPIDCFNLSVSNLQKVGLEVFMKNLPTKDAKGNEIEGWKRIMIDAIKKAADKVDWDKGGNATSWIAVVRESILAAANGPELDAMLRQLTGNYGLSAEKQKLIDDEKDPKKKQELIKMFTTLPKERRAEIMASLEKGVDEILGISPRTTLSTSLSVAGHKNFSACMKSADENPDGIVKRVECLQGAIAELEEPAIEFVAKNFPNEGSNLFVNRMGQHIRNVANYVYGNAKNPPLNPSGKSKRVASLVTGSIAAVTADGYDLLADKMVQGQDHRSSAGVLSAQLTPEQRREFRLHSGRAAAMIMGQSEEEFLQSLTAEDRAILTTSSGPGQGEFQWKNPKDQLALSNTFEFPHQPGKKGTLKECLESSANSIQYRGCIETARGALDENIHEWVAKNLPAGSDKNMSLVTSAIRETATRDVYGDRAHPKNIDKTEDERNALLISASLGRATTAIGSKLSDNYQTTEGRPDSLNEQSRVRNEMGTTLAGTLGNSVEAAAMDPAQSFAIGGTEKTIRQFSNRTAWEEFGMEQDFLRVFKNASEEPKSKKALSDWIGSMILGMDGREGLHSFRYARDEKPVKSTGFYRDLASSLETGIQQLQPGECDDIKSYLDDLDNEKLKTAIADASHPLLREIKFQATCDSAANDGEDKTRTPYDPKCACMARSGFMRTSQGNLFSSEVSIFAGLMRDASFDSKSTPGIADIGCTKKVSEFLDNRAPKLLKEAKFSFFKNPFEALGMAVMEDRSLKNSQGPKLSECMVIGNIQKLLMPMVQGFDEEFDWIKGPMKKILEPANLLAILQNKHPLNVNHPEVGEQFQAKLLEFAQLVGNPKKLSTSLGVAAKEFLAQGAQDLAMIALKTPAATRPLLEAFSSAPTKVRYAVDRAGGAGLVNASNIMSVPRLDSLYRERPEQMEAAAGEMMSPIALIAGTYAKKALMRDKVTMTREEENQCADNSEEKRNYKKIGLPKPSEYRDAQRRLASISCYESNTRDIEVGTNLAQLKRDLKAVQDVDGLFSPLKKSDAVGVITDNPKTENLVSHFGKSWKKIKVISDSVGYPSLPPMIRTGY